MTNGFRVSSRPSSTREAIDGAGLIGTCKLIARTPGQDYVWPRRMPATMSRLANTCWRAAR
jgi:hypothetical protein